MLWHTQAFGRSYRTSEGAQEKRGDSSRGLNPFTTRVFGGFSLNWMIIYKFLFLLFYTGTIGP
jgi:hypothetical protein